MCTVHETLVLARFNPGRFFRKAVFSIKFRLVAYNKCGETHNYEEGLSHILRFAFIFYPLIWFHLKMLLSTVGTRDQLSIG